jgi:hypothetical protein
MAPRIASMRLSPERLADLLPGDRFIVSFPRSGNAWTRTVLFEILQLRSGTPITDADHFRATTMHNSQSAEQTADFFNQVGPVGRVFKSHNITDLKGRKMVYQFRDPIDCLVSYYHFSQHRANLQETSLDAFCSNMAKSWVEHMELGLAHAKEFPELTRLQSYEALHRDTQGEFRAIAEFLGFDFTEEQLALALERAQFDNMKLARPDASKFLNRKGRVGTGEEELQPSTVAEVRSKTDHVYQAACQAG